MNKSATETRVQLRRRTMKTFTRLLRCGWTRGEASGLHCRVSVSFSVRRDINASQWLTTVFADSQRRYINYTGAEASMRGPSMIRVHATMTATSGRTYNGRQRGFAGWGRRALRNNTGRESATGMMTGVYSHFSSNSFCVSGVNNGTRVSQSTPYRLMIPCACPSLSQFTKFHTDFLFSPDLRTTAHEFINTSPPST
jgi:hypothetical protein